LCEVFPSREFFPGNVLYQFFSGSDECHKSTGKGSSDFRNLAHSGFAGPPYFSFNSRKIQNGVDGFSKTGYIMLTMLLHGITIPSLKLTGSPVYDRYVRAINRSFPEISPIHLFDFFENAKKSYDKSTLNVIKSALRRSVRISLLGADQGAKSEFESAFDEMKPGKISYRIEPDVLMTEAEIDSLIGGATHRIACIIRVLSATGLRISELVGTKLSDCQSSGNFVSIRVCGKGDSSRVVFLPLSLYDIINSAFSGKIFLFESVHGNPLSRNYVWREISRLGKSVLKRRITPHCFRHTFASTQLLEKRRSIKAVSKYLGHRSTTTTLKFYIHDDLKAGDLFPEVISV